MDVVLSFEGDRHARLRLVRGVKNRYGTTDEVGCFELHDEGITGLADPSGLFLTRRAEPVPGTCLTVTLEGRRPLVAEVQALTVDSQIPSPRRTTSGLETSRVSMMLAVLEQRGRISALGKRDIYSATVGGVKLSEPAADLAIALALASAASDTPLPKNLVAIGEVGLAGEVRRVTGVQRRLLRSTPPGLHARARSGRSGQGPARHEGPGSSGHRGRPEGPSTLASARGPTGRGGAPVDFAQVSPVRTNNVCERERPRTCDPRSAVAANDRAAAPGKSGGSSGADGLMRASLSAVAPGTPLRDGLERVLRGNTGGLMVLGSDKTVESMCTGGFVLDVEFTATRLRELCKLDGGIVLSSDLSKILGRSVQLLPDPTIPTEETGTRHRTADRVSKQVGFPVVSVSQSMRLIALYVDGQRRVLEDSAAILSRANQALATLERYKLRLDEVAGTLSALEIEDLVTVRDVSAVAQRLEMVRRIATEIAEYVVELGTDGRLLALQLDELIARRGARARTGRAGLRPRAHGQALPHGRGGAVRARRALPRRAPRTAHGGTGVGLHGVAGGAGLGGVAAGLPTAGEGAPPSGCDHRPAGGALRGPAEAAGRERGRPADGGRGRRGAGAERARGAFATGGVLDPGALRLGRSRIALSRAVPGGSPVSRSPVSRSPARTTPAPSRTRASSPPPGTSPPRPSPREASRTAEHSACGPTSRCT